jgi:cell division protein FtsL
MRMFACTMAFLFGLIMMYGWQHLSAINYGYHIEAEKAQVLQLEEQNRQLRLTEAQLGDPQRIDQLARQLGLAVPTPGQVVRPDAALDPGAPVLAEAHPLLPNIR